MGPLGDPALGEGAYHWVWGEVSLGLSPSSSCIWMDKYSGSGRAHGPRFHAMSAPSGNACDYARVSP